MRLLSRPKMPRRIQSHKTSRRLRHDTCSVKYTEDHMYMVLNPVHTKSPWHQGLAGKAQFFPMRFQTVVYPMKCHHVIY